MIKVNTKEILYKWLMVEFESSSGETEEFKNFSSFIKNFFKESLKKFKNFEVVKFSKGHFEISIFIKNKDNNKFSYIKIGNVRSSCWFKNVLFRTAKDEKDYSGGRNNFAYIENVVEEAVKLLK